MSIVGFAGRPSRADGSGGDAQTEDGEADHGSHDDDVVHHDDFDVLADGTGLGDLGFITQLTPRSSPTTGYWEGFSHMTQRIPHRTRFPRRRFPESEAGHTALPLYGLDLAEFLQAGQAPLTPVTGTLVPTKRCPRVERASVEFDLARAEPTCHLQSLGRFARPHGSVVSGEDVVGAGAGLRARVVGEGGQYRSEELLPGDAQEEICGPEPALIPYDSVEEAVTIANDTV